MITPATPAPVRGFPFFLDLDELSLVLTPPDRLHVRPWLLVALPEAISGEVTVGLEAVDFNVRHAESASDVVWIVADTLASVGGHPPLCIIVSGRLADQSTLGLLDTLRRVGSTVPIVVCVDEPSQRAAFAKRGAMMLDSATALSIVAAAVGLPKRVCEKARRHSR